jgi:hypothetical protein
MRAGVLAWVLAGAVGGCSGATPDAQAPDGGGGGATPPPGELCTVSLLAAPTTATAGPTTTVRVSAHVFNGPGTLSYRWTARFDGRAAVTLPVAGDDDSQVNLPVPDPGVYDVTVEVIGAPTTCMTGQLPINVRAPGAHSALVRLRVTPPDGAGAPPTEKLVQIDGGATVDLGTVPVDQGVMADVVVSGPGGGVPAYLRFAPAGAPDAIVEAFADSTGRAKAQLVAGTHTVLVVPQRPDLAPRRIAGWSSATAAIAVDAGTMVSGTVDDPAGDALAGATVQVAVDGVPSTVATTAADGSFVLHAAIGGGPVIVQVTPPAASGLPRLSATSSVLDLRMAMQIRYAGNVTLKDLEGTVVRRQGAQGPARPVPGAVVTVVGTLAAVGIVTAGMSASATGEVRITATTDAAGALPAMLVPSPQPSETPLAAVIAVAPGDLAVASLDTSTGVPANLDAPAMQPIITAMFDAATARLSGGVLDCVPTGALAMAAAPVLHATADATGAVTIALAAGGHYDLRLRDPSGRAAPLVVTDRVIATVATSYHLPTSLEVRGTVKLGGTQPLPGAAVQFLCASCTGVDRGKPISEVASDAAGRFVLAVPDPGTM